ncbi:P-loop containing nucleoside triphosphate hydrolase protein [Suhomyces tanzawaensis NRRL Y-17324]|uniref:p-loop containing nucleoside triphosphate hydrolase protein n=1 Tax=Suhomyces tanzawaensis NRRL Y-17324 TaxID=984487 RepID=A0A1E4SR01_9ASCO|nr:P-loop containing nucleoside triphosphate hydrolase protein [Suhomyces tanzawaensis NRRL Y-17324]ODV81940.1 P-loop containing nucleoside triphosphate hydrolase protein [Suhomyces tanzawaensis NRRL Y-17324]
MSEHTNKGALHPEQKKWKAPKGPKPIQHKNKNLIGLGRTIANQRRLENQVQYLPDGDLRFTTDKKEADWVKMQSKTQENSLDEFLSTAQLADTDFTAERGQQVKIIKIGNTSIVNQTGLLSTEEMMAMKQKHHLFENKLTIPKRPKWTKDQSKLQIDRQENLAFLEWRRELAALTEVNDLLLTPFERNLEVWKQLWRVVERSDLVVQIVDARNPLFFRSIDLEKYVNQLSDPENNKTKKNLLLVNKADLLTRNQRIKWAEYFNLKKIDYVFFSAAKANELLEKEKEELENAQNDIISSTATESKVEEEEEGEEEGDINDDIRILKIEELEELFMKTAPKLEEDPDFPDRKLNIGLVGYPNVGKSSTINALVGSKKVSVSSTPGKTKHFQTIHLSQDVLLCDCPGLVFPNFAYTNGELVCDGVLPIDQLREHIPPVSLVCQRIPKFYLEAIYGIHIPIQRVEDGGNGIYPTARELLNAYARARGYMTQGFGSADEPRASRYILKDYVNGKLLYIVPPPKAKGNDEWDLPSLDECRAFNKELYGLKNLPESRRQQIETAIHNKNLKVDDFDLSNDLSKLNFSMHIGDDSDEGKAKTLFYGGRQAALESAGDDLDREFFKMNGVTGKLNTPFHKKDGESKSGKKHNKKNKKQEKKVRVVGY